MADEIKAAMEGVSLLHKEYAKECWENKSVKGGDVELRRTTVCKESQEIDATFTVLPGDPVRQAKLLGKRREETCLIQRAQVMALGDTRSQVSLRSELSLTGNLLPEELKLSRESTDEHKVGSFHDRRVNRWKTVEVSKD
jgi:hypothetical protein